jgi:hypothetical protein
MLKIFLNFHMIRKKLKPDLWSEHLFENREKIIQWYFY